MVRFSLIALALLAGPVFGQKQLISHNYNAQGTTRILVESVFSHGLTRGYMPVVVTIRNGIPQDRTWNVNFQRDGSWNSFNYRSNFSVPAKGNSEVIYPLLVPVPTAMNGSNWGQTNVSINAPGLGGQSRNDSINYNTSWPSIGISKKLADRNLTQLNDHLNSSGFGADTFGGRFDPKQLPGDWRGYTGIDVLMIEAGEWSSVTAGPKKAIREWLHMGGRLEIYTTNGGMVPADFGFGEKPQLAGKAVPISLGWVQVRQWSGKELDKNAIVNRYRPVKNQSLNFGEDFKSQWALQQAFGIESFDPILIFLLLIVFGVVVGPVNLFVFAKPGQRHKLFVTTPIISLIASLLIFGLIMLRDGIGGNGQRIAFANLQSQDNNLYLIQEQISRTGVLLNTRFKLNEAAFITPVLMRSSEWNRLMDSNGNVSGAFSLTGNDFRGDWFQSRSEQGQAIQAVRPTRSRIELRAPAGADKSTPPELFSSLEFTMSEFFYRDDDGNVWKSEAPRIAPGNKIPLVATDFNELNKWWREASKKLSSSQRDRIRKLTGSNGRFFAVSTDPKSGLIDTLGSVRWRDDEVLVSGTLSDETAAGAPASAPAEDGRDGGKSETNN
ncbi:MAG: hypothetical protein HKN23_07840 [Verrucomicrobiales bacterium]|nr:hypothetical protein [Verrucomicrobiales bacterium]